MREYKSIINILDSEIKNASKVILAQRILSFINKNYNDDAYFHNIIENLFLKDKIGIHNPIKLFFSINRRLDIKVDDVHDRIRKEYYTALHELRTNIKEYALSGCANILNILGQINGIENMSDIRKMTTMAYLMNYSIMVHHISKLCDIDIRAIDMCDKGVSLDFLLNAASANGREYCRGLTAHEKLWFNSNNKVNAFTTNQYALSKMVNIRSNYGAIISGISLTDEVKLNQQFEYICDNIFIRI